MGTYFHIIRMLWKRNIWHWFNKDLAIQEVCFSHSPPQEEGNYQRRHLCISEKRIVFTKRWSKQRDIVSCFLSSVWCRWCKWRKSTTAILVLPLSYAQVFLQYHPTESYSMCTCTDTNHEDIFTLWCSVWIQFNPHVIKYFRYVLHKIQNVTKCLPET